jgi:phage baseplate assembly protein V
MSFAVPRSNRRTSGVGDYESTDVARNIGSLLRFGKVHSVDHAQRLCRVALPNDLITDDLPWITFRAGGNVFWAAPSVDEAVLLLCPSGELNNGVVLPALQNNPNGTYPFNFSDLEYKFGDLGDPREGLWRWIFSDGAILENDPVKNQFRVEQNQTRFQGKELLHLHSEKFIYIEADEEQGIVHIKAPMIKLDGDVHITGQLMQTGRIIGIEKSGEGIKSLDLVGDPINLNSNGGVLGMLAGLLGSVAGGALSLGQLGSIMGGGANGLIGGLQNLANGVLGAGGLESLMTAAGGLNISGIGAAMNVVGGLPVLGEVMNGLGFVGSVLQGPTGTALSALTSGSGLNLAGAFQGLSGLTGAIGDHFNIPALSNLSDLTALPALESIISGGQLTINDVMDVASGAAGAFGAPVDVTNAINFASSAAATVAGTDPNDGSAVFEAGLTLFQNGGGAIMDGLLGNNSRVSAEQIAHKISELNLASTLESLEAAGVNGGQAIGSLISDGAITLEQVLDLSSVFQGGPDAVATAAAGMNLGGEQKFFDTFERAAPGDVPARDMSSKRGSDTDPKEQQPPPDAYSDWNTVYT